jgi:hypothetical protein
MVDGYLPILGFLSLGYTHIYASLLQRHEFGIPLDDPSVIEEMAELVRFHQSLTEYMVLPDQEMGKTCPVVPGFSVNRALLPFFSTLRSSVKQCRADLELMMEEGEIFLSQGAFTFPITGAIMTLLDLHRESLATICRDNPVWPVSKERSIIVKGSNEGKRYRCSIYAEGSGTYGGTQLFFPSAPRL